MWKSTAQSLPTLSNTDTEYIALYSALREVIGVINLLEDLESYSLPLHTSNYIVKYHTFSFNMSCANMANTHKTLLCTEHLFICICYVWLHIIEKIITVEDVSTMKQLVDVMTNPLPRKQFCNSRQNISTFVLYILF